MRTQAIYHRGTEAQRAARRGSRLKAHVPEDSSFILHPSSFARRRARVEGWQKISALLLQGVLPREIRARWPHVASSKISRCRARLGLKPFRRGRPAGLSVRNVAIVAEAARLNQSCGLSFNRIAQQFGISRQRLDQLQHPEKHRARVARYLARLKEAARA